MRMIIGKTHRYYKGICWGEQHVENSRWDISISLIKMVQVIESLGNEKEGECPPLFHLTLDLYSLRCNVKTLLRVFHKLPSKLF